MPALVVLTTAPDRKAAERLARSLVKERLAACVTVLPGAVSRYRWKGKETTSREAVMLVKTPASKFAGLKRFMDKNHPYDVPELVALRVAKGSAAYLSWLDASTR